MLGKTVLYCWAYLAMIMEDIEIPFVHFSYRLDLEGYGKKLSKKAISQAIKDERLAWMHLDATHPQTREWLEQEIDYLDPLILDALLADGTRPRMIEFEGGLLLILKAVNFNADSDPEDMVSMRLWIDPHRIISLERRPVKVIRDFEELILKGLGPKSASDFLVQLCSLLFERMDPVLAELDEAMDDIEEEALEDPSTDERQIVVEIRKQAIIFKRYIYPQRDVILSLCNSKLEWISELNKRHLRESYDCVLRYVESLDEIRERAQIVKDELSNALSERLNKNTYFLSVIAAIFLPLGFLTGLWGANIEGIPGAQHPHAFWLFSASLFFIVAFQVFLFKRFKWF